jgi:VWFA-related protein
MTECDLTSRVVTFGRRLLAFWPLPVVAVLTAQATSQQPPVFRGGIDIFEFEVSVLNSAHEPVRGLTKADFSVLEDGKPRSIVGFSEVEFPEHKGPVTEGEEESAPDVTRQSYADRRLFAVVMDDWGLPAATKEDHNGWPPWQRLVIDAKAIAKRVVDSLGPADLAAIVLSRDTRYFPDFTNNSQKLYGAIKEFSPVARDSAQRSKLQRDTRGHIGGIPALLDVTNYLAKLPQHRKAIIYVGVGPGAPTGGMKPSVSLSDLFKAAKLAGIGISVIDPSGLTTVQHSDFLLTMAETTGGVAVVDRNDFLDGIPQIFLENHSYYLLGYQRPGRADGGYRRLEVRVNRPGVEIRARTGYLAAGKPEMVKAPPMPVDSAVEEAIRRLGRDEADRQLFTYVVSRPSALAIAVEIGASAASQPKWTRSAGLQVTVAVTRSGGGVVTTAHGQIEPGARGVLLELPFEREPQPEASPGGFHVSVRATNGVDVLADETDPVPAGTLLGAPLLYRALSLPKAAMRPAAEFAFGRTEQMRVDWPLLGSTERRQVRILRRTGEAMNFAPTLVERELNGRPIVSTEFSLSVFAPGDYILELAVQSGSIGDRQLLAFKVVQ